MRILAVDDDPLHLTLLRVVIRTLGAHEVHVAADGAAGWAAYQRLLPHTVVLDWQMPGLLGPDLVRAIRAHPAGSAAYIMLLTAHDGPGHALEAIQAGADDFLNKPLAADTLRLRLLTAERLAALHATRARALARARALLHLSGDLATAEDEATLLARAHAAACELLETPAAALALAATPRGPARVAASSLDGLAAGDELPAGEIEAALRDAAARRVAVVPCNGHGEGPAAAPVLVAPLEHRSVLLGALAVAHAAAASPEDEAFLALLAAVIAAALAGHRHARLEGVLLTARSLEHELNNRLAVVYGYTELLLAREALSPSAAAAARQMHVAIGGAVEVVDRLRNLTRLEELTWGGGIKPTLRLD